MKTFLQHDENGLFYREDGWVDSLKEARSFTTDQDAEAYRRVNNVRTAHTVRRLDPALIVRFQTRAPGRYQAGE